MLKFSPRATLKSVLVERVFLVCQQIYENTSYNICMNDIIGVRIKETRMEAKLTQAEFGKKLNVSQDTISLWEKHKSLPQVEHIIMIAQLFDVTSDYLLGLKDY